MHEDYYTDLNWRAPAAPTGQPGRFEMGTLCNGLVAVLNQRQILGYRRPAQPKTRSQKFSQSLPLLNIGRYSRHAALQLRPSRPVPRPAVLRAPDGPLRSTEFCRAHPGRAMPVTLIKQECRRWQHVCAVRIVFCLPPAGTSDRKRQYGTVCPSRRRCIVLPALVSPV